MKKKIPASVVAARATIAAAIITGIFLIANSKLNSKRDTEKTTNQNSPVINGNQNTVINGDSNTIVNSVVFTDRRNVNEFPNISTQKKNNISIQQKNQKLYQELTKNYNLSISNSALNLISINATGNIITVNNSELFSYTGGYLAIFVNGNLCHKFTDIQIAATSNYGNSRKNIEDFIDAEVKKNIETNYKKIAIYIKKCLN